MKQIIVMRADLNMRKGKMIAQGAHASVSAVLVAQAARDPRLDEWLKGSYTKICVRADSLEELREVFNKAEDAGLIACMITDNGLTEFNGIPTTTCCAIGPDTDEKINPITGHLRLL